MKTRISVLLSALFIFLGSCQSNNYADTYVEFHPQHQAYKVWVPKDWKIKEHQKSGTIRAIEPQSEKPGKFQTNLTITTQRGPSVYNKEKEEMEPQKIDLDDFVPKFLRNFKSRHKIEKDVAIEDTEVNGQAAKRFKTEYTESGASLVSEIYFVDYGSKSYMLRLTAEQEHVANYETTFKEIIGSFKLR